MEKIRVGLIGTGIGRELHLPGYARCPEYQVVSICSVPIERARDAADAFGIPDATDSVEDIVRNDCIELVDICTPPRLHRDTVQRALEHHKHVICEKPFGLNVAEAEDMCDRAHTSGVVHAVNYEMRYLPAQRQLRRLVQQGVLGELRLVAVDARVDFGTKPTLEGRISPWSTYYWNWMCQAAEGGGLLTGLLSHYIDIVRFCFGAITDVTGNSSTTIKERPVLTHPHGEGMKFGPDLSTIGLRPVDADDTAVLNGILTGGTLLTMTGSWSLHHAPGTRLEAYGSDATALIDSQNQLLVGKSDDPNMTLWPIDQDLLLAAPQGQDSEFVPLFSAFATDLASEIRDGGGLSDRSTFDDGLAMRKVIHAVDPPNTSIHEDSN